MEGTPKVVTAKGTATVEKRSKHQSLPPNPGAMHATGVTSALVPGYGGKDEQEQVKHETDETLARARRRKGVPRPTLRRGGGPQVVTGDFGLAGLAAANQQPPQPPPPPPPQCAGRTCGDCLAEDGCVWCFENHPASTRAIAGCHRVAEGLEMSHMCPSTYRIAEAAFLNNFVYVAAFHPSCIPDKHLAWTVGMEFEVNAKYYRIEADPGAPGAAAPPVVLKKGFPVKAFGRHTRYIELQAEESTTQPDEWGLEFVTRPIPLTPESHGAAYEAFTQLEQFCTQLIAQETQGNDQPVVINGLDLVPGVHITRYGAVKNPIYLGLPFSPQMTIALPVKRVAEVFENNKVREMLCSPGNCGDGTHSFVSVMAKSKKPFASDPAVRGFAYLMALYAKSWSSDAGTDPKKYIKQTPEVDPKDGILPVLVRSQWHFYYQAVDPASRYKNDILDFVRRSFPAEGEFEYLDKIQFAEYHDRTQLVTTVGQWIRDILDGKGDDLNRVHPSLGTAKLQVRNGEYAVIVEFRKLTTYVPADCATVVPFFQKFWGFLEQWLGSGTPTKSSLPKGKATV